MTEKTRKKKLLIIENSDEKEVTNLAKIPNLEKEFKKLNCDDENYYSSECNKFLLKKEIAERNYLSKHPDETPYLYPDLNDKNFNIKIAEKQEFNDTKYDSDIDNIDNIKEISDKLANAEFELSPHQAFVKNFMSLQTPYNSLLLFHGLGSGKTCSAIGVCEETRDFFKQMGITKRIIIVASENVQDNFKLQLFDERKLKVVDGIWNIRGCTGNKFIKEINPMNMSIPRDKIISQIKNLINSYYLFLGYGQFANYIIKTMNYEEEINREKSNLKSGEKTLPENIKVKLNKKIIKRLRNEFNDRLIVIDEVHNIRKTDDNKNKKVAINLELLVKSAQNLRLLLLSATPMYNSYEEIVWLLNLMNINDRRSKVETPDVFDTNGKFKTNGGKEVGEELFIQKATGYVSFVRGENPFTFPFRVYPNEFAKDNTFQVIKYPSHQMNLTTINETDKSRILSLYLNTIGNCDNCGKCQYCVYKYIIYNLRNKNFSVTTKTGKVKNMPSFENMESFGYTLLQKPLEALIISYPVPGLKQILDELPKPKVSTKMAKSFSKIKPLENKKQDDEEPGYVDDNEDEEEEMPEIEFKTITNPKPKGKKKFVIENEDEDVEAVVKPKTKPKDKKKLIIENEDENNLTGGVLKIDVKELTGKLGLQRVMNFVDDKSPPKKGDFEYKKTTLNEYGKIFTQDNIGNFSWKIKNILDSILNPTTNKVSDGVILVYSQYIDAALIPVALALEEMGFTRYGENVTTLFKNRPTEVVDVRTMQPPTNKKSFLPARYSIITGDERLSPNNDFEVKGVTGENNKDGNIVKVILISKAGSEGIDLKFIRQVHILEPWYNMNRIEQIIGRAVRNFSHKDLPFDKRNVQIFMYGTILENNEEEAADLYVYRVAEYKALQIGKVTRVLKETAIDCIVNHDQTMLTQEEIAKRIKKPVKQILSNGMIIDNFKIGDIPFSPACDYMASCNYSCRPNKVIDEDNLNRDTYDEKFTMMNFEKILQRIRMLMKESFFYKKDMLIDQINTPREYPLIQIYAALTHIIEDKNEIIVDKYGRNGRLINIEEYYLFQPSELKDKNVSIFERSVPIDYKHSMINFEIKPDIAKHTVEERKSEVPKDIQQPKSSSTHFLHAKKILDEMKENINVSLEHSKLTKVPRGDADWYKHYGIVMKKMSKDYPNSKGSIQLKILLHHMVDLLLFHEKLDLLNYLESKDTLEGNIEEFLKEYFDDSIIKVKNIVNNKLTNDINFKAIIMFDLNKIFIMKYDETQNKWVKSEPEERKEIQEYLKKLLDENKTNNSNISKAEMEQIELAKLIEKTNIDDFNKIIGFVGYEKSNKYLVFKTKDMSSTRDTGARCDEAGKDKTMKKINEILGETKYTNETTKAIKDASGKVISESINQAELCVIQEFILRYFNITNKNNKIWFLTPEMAIYKKLYKIVV
jgi:hypothetical protein